MRRTLVTLLRGIGLGLVSVHRPRGVLRRRVRGDEPQRLGPGVDEVVVHTGVDERQVTGTDLLLDLEPGSLRLSLGGVSASVPASCPTTGRLIVSREVLETLQFLARDLKTTDFEIAITEDKLSVGRYSFRCRIVATQDRPIRLALNASLRDVLALPYRYSETEIESAGLTEKVASAVAKKDKTVSKAADLLKPFGVAEEMLQDIVEERLREHAKRNL